MAVTLAEAQLRNQRQKDARRRLFGGAWPGTTVRGHRWKLLQHAIEHIGSNTRVVVLEFGVADGQSTAFLAKKFVSPGSLFFGFDSFEGLPEDWTPGPVIAKGTHSTEGSVPDIGDRRVRFVKGWFQDTVQKFFRASHFTSAILVHFDADLYSSTLFLLASLWQSVPEYFFVMDDFAFDECVALHDFSSAFPVEIEWLAARRNENGTPVQVFGRIRKSALKIS